MPVLKAINWAPGEIIITARNKIIKVKYYNFFF